MKQGGYPIEKEPLVSCFENPGLTRVTQDLYKGLTITSFPDMEKGKGMQVGNNV